MGRSGGRSSGSRSSGGRSSGSRSSGGRSSVGRSSSRSASSSFGGRSSRSGSSSFSRSSSRASSSSFRGSSFGRSTSHINYRPVYINNSRGGVVHRTSRTSSAGCITAIIVVVIITILVIALYVVASNSGMEVTKSTIERVALPKGSVNETGYYTDELGWIRNKTKLETGLKNFYNKTGVQPYLYITDSINGTHYPDTDDFEIFASQLYDELFTDEAHLLFIFLEYNNEFTNFYLCGAQAKTVIDSEAADILLDYIDRYYYDSSLSDEEVFSKAFSDAADRIMTITRSPWSYFFIVIGVLLILVVLFRWWQKSKEQKNLEREQREKILNTPLEQFGSDEAEDLAKKYEQND